MVKDLMFSGCNTISEYLNIVMQNEPGMLHRQTNYPSIPLISNQLHFCSEKKFAQALIEQKVVPYFQSIVEINKDVKGFELLARLSDDGEIISPVDFLPHLKSKTIWALFTTYILDVAIQKINQFSGKIYFSVNVTQESAEDGSLIHIVLSAMQRLNDPTWIDRLILEFPETTNIATTLSVPLTINILKKTGVRVVIDDCFSESSVMFPARSIQFNGFKLDRSIVNRFLTNKHDACLISTLLFIAGRIVVYVSLKVWTLRRN